MNHDQSLQSISKTGANFSITESSILAEMATNLHTDANEANEHSNNSTKSNGSENLVDKDSNISVIHRIKISSLKSINGNKLYENNKNTSNPATNVTTEKSMVINILNPISTMSVLALISSSNDNENLNYFQNMNYFCNETINLYLSHLIELELEYESQAKERQNEQVMENEGVIESVFEKQKQFGVVFPLPNHIYGFFKLENIEISLKSALLNNKNIRNDTRNNWLDIVSSSDLISQCENLHLDSKSINKEKRKPSLGSNIEFSMKPPIQTRKLSSFLSSSSMSLSLTTKDDESESTSLGDDYQIEKKVFTPEGDGKDQELPQMIIENPIDFLTTRYYSTLYSLNNPLSYFPKTALPRFKNLFKGNLDENNNNNNVHEEHSDSRTSNIIEGLWGFWLNSNAFDRRHNQKYGIFGDITKGSDNDMNYQVLKALIRIELIEQQKFKSHHGFELDQPMPLSENPRNSEIMDIDNKGENEDQLHGITMEKLSQFILDLKIREAQLQILIIFELLNLMQVEEQEFLTENIKIQEEKEAQKSKNQSLVRRKRRKNKKKQSNSDKDISSPASTQNIENEKHFELFMSLTTYIDRLSLWDTLSVKTGGAGMYGFIGYVLVPYFHKKLPKLVEFVVENMKSLNMKLISLKRKKSDQVDQDEHEQIDKEMEKGIRPRDSDTPKHQDDTHKTKPRSKYRKVLLDKNPPKLSKSTSIADSDDFKPLISLKKSKSNLSAKHLSKREVDLNLKQSSKADLSSISTVSLSFIFGTRAKKSLSTTTTTVTTSRSTRTKSEAMSRTPIKPKLTHSVSQIEATPAKSRKVYIQPQVQATPLAPAPESQPLLLQQPIPVSPSHRENHTNTGSIANTLNEPAYLLEVEATPYKSNMLVITTTTDQFIRPNTKQRQSINEKLLSLSKDLNVEMTPKQNILVFSTPRNNSAFVDDRNNNKGVSNDINMVINTPLHRQQLIGSSPLKFRRESVSSVTSVISNTNNNNNDNLDNNGHGKSGPKPGDPIALESSPFISILSDSENLMGSRPKKLFDSISTSPYSKDYANEKVVKDNYGKKDYDSEYDSDELLNPSTKRNIKSTYSKRRK